MSEPKPLPPDIVHILRSTPGARLVTGELRTLTGIQEVRDHFRSARRLATVERLITISDDEVDRVLAADNLGAFGPRGVAALTRALSGDPGWRVRQHAAIALGRTGVLAAAPALEAARADPAPQVRLAAAEALDVLPIMAELSAPQPLHDAAPDDLAAATVYEDEQLGVSIDLEEMRLWEFTHRRANQLLNTGQFEAAGADFQALLDMTPAAPSALIGRGKVYETQARWQEAMGDYTEAITSEQLTRAWRRRGQRAKNGAEGSPPAPPDAQSSPEAAEDDTILAEAYKRRAICHRNLQGWGAARSDYEQALVLNPEDAQTWANYAETLLTFQEFEPALLALDRAIALRPEYAVAHLNRAGALLQLGRYEEALSSTDAAIAARPDYAKAFLNRGLIFAQLGQAERATADLERALELDPSLIHLLKGVSGE